MAKYISYSLYGSDPMYTEGAVQNVIQARSIYPGWQTLFYTNNSVPKAILDSIEREGGRLMYETEIKYPKFWRFLANDLEDAEVWLSRDTDSRLTFREKEAVDAFLVSKKGVHIMRDHAHHAPHNIMGGMWGAKKGIIPNMRQTIKDWLKTHNGDGGADQDFTSDAVWRIARDNCLQHASVRREAYPGAIPFPSKRFGTQFVGEIIKQDGQPLHRYNACDTPE